MRMSWSSASYSASLLEALLKLICRTYLSFVPLGETSTTPAPAPCCLLDPSKNIVHELDRSGGGLVFGPLSTRHEVWEYLGFDCCWVLELQVSQTELNVPLSGPAGRFGV